jgi:hypothetical protein
MGSINSVFLISRPLFSFRFRNLITSLILVCTSVATLGKDVPFKTTVLRDQNPRVVAKHRPMIGNRCFNEVIFEVSINDRQQLNVNSEVCMGLDDIRTLSSQIAWSPPLLSIKETCSGNSLDCESLRALIFVRPESAKRIGTFTDFVNLKDQKLILHWLLWPTYNFISTAEYNYLRYVSTLERDGLVFAKDLTWILNHEEFFRFYNHITKCGPQRFDCKALAYNSVSLKTALLFTAQLAVITERLSYLNVIKARAAELLDSSDNASFLAIIDKPPILK